jgi:leader peptidase (prepilin peptidase)/N-methyltransferase
MVWAAATDARRFRISNSAVLLALGLGLLHTAIDEFGSLVLDVSLAMVRGATVALMFAALRSGYRALRGREGLGLGDVKLAIVAGVWLDWETLAIAIALASLSGLVFYGCYQVLTGGALRAVSRIPFGLYFAPAIWLGWLIESPRLVPL